MADHAPAPDTLTHRKTPMTTFAFVALCLILFAIAGSFAVLWLKEKIDTRINRSERATDQSLEEHRTCLADLIADVSEIRESLKVLENRKPADDKPLTATMPNQFQKMEKRYAEKFGNTLVVNGVETPAS